MEIIYEVLKVPMSLTYEVKNTLLKGHFVQMIRGAAIIGYLSVGLLPSV